MQLVDSHAHLNMENYKKDLEEVIARAKEKGIVKVLVVGIDRKTGEKALA
jgi:Mg-dependent DNase